MKRLSLVFKVLEIVQMFCIDIQNDGVLRIEREEAIGIFTRFRDKSLAMANANVGVDRLKDGSNRNGWICIFLKENLRNHGSSGSFAVRSADSNRFLEVLHDGTEKFCASHHGFTTCFGCKEFRIVRMDCCGIYEDIGRRVDILSCLRVANASALGFKAFCEFTFLAVGTCYFESSF